MTKPVTYTVRGVDPKQSRKTAANGLLIVTAGANSGIFVGAKRIATRLTLAAWYRRTGDSTIVGTAVPRGRKPKQTVSLADWLG